MNRDKFPGEGHRNRLRQRFLKSGFDGFHDYEVIELLLTYGIPRKDTKPIAKDLLRRYGTIPRVLDAPLEKLQEVDGIGDNAALFLRLLRETITEYFKGMVLERKAFKTLGELVEYLNAVIGGRQSETVNVLYLNTKNDLLHSEDLGEG